MGQSPWFQGVLRLKTVTDIFHGSVSIIYAAPSEKCNDLLTNIILYYSWWSYRVSKHFWILCSLRKKKVSLFATQSFNILSFQDNRVVIVILWQCSLFFFFSLSVYVSTNTCAAQYVSVLAVCDGNEKKRKNESQLKRAVCMFFRLYFTETCFFFFL